MRNYCNLLYADTNISKSLIRRIESDNSRISKSFVQKVKYILLSLTWYEYEY